MIPSSAVGPSARAGEHGEVPSLPSRLAEHLALTELQAFALDVGLSGQVFLSLTLHRDERGLLRQASIVGMNLAARRLAAVLQLEHLQDGVITDQSWPVLLDVLSGLDDSGEPARFEVTEPASGHTFDVVARVFGEQAVLAAHDTSADADAADELAALRRAFTEIIDAMPVGVVRWEPVLDVQGQVIDLVATLSNPAAWVYLGRPGQDMRGYSMRRDWPGIERTGRWEPHIRVWETGQPWLTEVGGTEAPFGPRRVITVVRLRDALLSTVVDVHDRWLAEQELIVSEARARALVQGSPTPVVVLDADLHCLQANDAALHLFGLAREQLVGAAFESLIKPADPQETETSFLALLSGEVDVVQKERPVNRGDGTRRWVRIIVSAVRDPAGEMHWFVAHLLDVTEDRADAARLRHEATHDPLTGLPNRVLLEERLLHAQERRPGRRAAGEQEPAGPGIPDPEATHVAVVFVDLDGLKAINDRHGHAAGDILLTDTARRLALATRAHDTVARLGGDEFVVLLEDVTVADVVLVAQRIAETLAQPFELAGGRLAEGASIGVALALPGEPPRRVLERADVAMYADKRRRKAAMGPTGPGQGSARVIHRGNDYMF